MPVWTSCRVSRMQGLAILLALAACGTNPEKIPPRNLAAAQASLQKAATLQLPPGFAHDLYYSRAVVVVSPRAGAVAMGHRQPGPGQFSGPMFYTLTRLNPTTGGAGTGFTRMPQDRELIAAFMSETSMQRLETPKPSSRADLRMVAAGASTGERAGADVILLDLDSPQAPKLEFDLTLITIDAAANQAWYGREITPAQILAMPSPPSAEVQALQKSIADLSQEQKR